MKKKIFAILLAGTLVLSSSPPVFADEKDDKIEQLEAQISEMQKTIDELQKQLDEASSGAKSTSQDTYKIGESYVVEGQWKITVDSVETTDDRNEYSDKNPAAVYLVTYTYENLGYDDDIMNGLYISLDDGIVDSAGKWDIHILETSQCIHKKRLSEPPVRLRHASVLIMPEVSKLTFIITTAIIKSNQLFLKLMFNLTRRG